MLIPILNKKKWVFFSCYDQTIINLISICLISDEIEGTTIDEKTKFVENLLIKRFKFAPNITVKK
jgi:hypothetical protein